MKKQLLIVFIALSIEHTITSIPFSDPSVLMAFSKRVNLTADELNAGLNFANNTPSKKQPFNLSIQSKEKEVCYELKTENNSISHCIDKKRAAEFIIAYIQVCIEKNLEGELKKAQEMLYQLLCKGSSLVINSNGLQENNNDNGDISIQLRSPKAQFSTNLKKDEDPNDPSLKKTHIDCALDNKNINSKINLDIVTKKDDSPDYAGSYDQEIIFSGEVALPKQDVSAKISTTHYYQPDYDSDNKSYKAQNTAQVTVNSQKSGPIEFTAEFKEEGASSRCLDSEKKVSLTTENSQTNAEWTTDEYDELTSHNVTSKYKKPTPKN